MDAIFKEIKDSPIKFGTLTASLVTVGYICIKGVYGSDKHNYPPGPPKDPIIGNLRQFPKNRFWATFCDWAKTYGPIVHVKIPGVSVVVLNSYEVAQELLNKRTNTTAGRGIGYMLIEVMNWNWSLAFMQPGPRHSNQRKMLRRGIGPQRLGSHNPLIEKCTAKLMLQLHDFQGDPPPLVLDAMGSLVLEVTYGNEIRKTLGDELALWNLEAMHLVNDAFFEFWLVDVFHFLRFIPSWFPGAKFKRIGDRSAWLSDQVRYKPFETVKELYNTGKLGHCLATDLLDEFGPNDDARDTLALLYTAGSDTTTAAIIAFFHVMFLFPDIADKVYKEIEGVTNGERLLQVTDRPNLPYTEAAWKEAWRWHPFLPIGVPHVNSQDEVVNGYFIPKGTLINLNNGFMLTDPSIWGDPDVFRPERFLEAGAYDLPNPMTLIFGYGARVCPGMYLADKAGFCISAAVISLYNILPLEGAKVPDPETVEYTDTAFRLPVGFECRFVPRDERAENLIKTISLSD